MDKVDDRFVSFAAATVLLTVLAVGMTCVGYLAADRTWRHRMEEVGIDNIVPHYTETDGVRSNWYEVVWREAK